MVEKSGAHSSAQSATVFTHEERAKWRWQLSVLGFIAAYLCLFPNDILPIGEHVSLLTSWIIGFILLFFAWGKLTWKSRIDMDFQTGRVNLSVGALMRRQHRSFVLSSAAWVGQDNLQVILVDPFLRLTFPMTFADFHQAQVTAFRLSQMSGLPMRGLHDVTNGFADANEQSAHTNRSSGARVFENWPPLVIISFNIFVYLQTHVLNSVEEAPWFQMGALDATRVMVFHEYYRLLTHQFLHANWLHIAMNMLAVWSLWRPLAYKIGHARVLAIYLLSGVLGGATSLYFLGTHIGVGASGAVFGIFGAIFYLVVFKKRFRGTDYYFDISLSDLSRDLILNFAISLLPGILLSAHAGGFAAGFVICGWLMAWARSSANS